MVLTGVSLKNGNLASNFHNTKTVFIKVVLIGKKTSCTEH